MFKNKTAIALAALVGLFASSCDMNPDISDNNKVDILLILSAEYKYEDKTAVEKYEWKYGNIDVTGITENYKFTASDIVVKELIISGNSDVDKVTYQYDGKEALTVSKFGLVPTVEKYKLYKVNSKNTYVARTQILENEESTYYIKYDENGYRTKVNDIELMLDKGLYKQAYKEDEKVAEYEYTALLNKFGTQQFGLPGAEFHWVTKVFGMQNPYLLKSITVNENEKYTFKYTYYENDDAKGQLKAETIYKNEELFLTINYKYIIGTIDMTK